VSGGLGQGALRVSVSLNGFSIVCPLWNHVLTLDTLFVLERLPADGGGKIK